MTKQFEIGSGVAWQLADGNTMAGHIFDFTYNRHAAYIERVDGSSCGPIQVNDLRESTFEDIQRAVEFFAHIGS